MRKGSKIKLFKVQNLSGTSSSGTYIFERKIKALNEENLELQKKLGKKNTAV